MRDVDLLGSYWTLAGGAFPHTDREYSPFDFKDRVETAARVGFKGIGLWHADLEHILKTRTLEDMKIIFEDNGIKHVELEFLTDWFLEPGERRQKSDEQRKQLLTAAEALGARHIKVGDFFDTPCPKERLAESFAGLCKDAADHGTKVLYEVMPFANVKTIEDSLAMFEGSGADNGGFILDLWHLIIMNVPYEQIAKIPGKYLLGVELNDGPLEWPEDLHQETIDNRKLCGKGHFDIAGFINAVEKTGYDGPYGIEVLSKELRAMPMVELITTAYETTIAQFKNL